MHEAHAPNVPPLSGPLDGDGYVESVGERSALFGTERGPFEWWAWPLKVASDLRLTLHLPGTRAPIALEALPGTCEVTPGALRLVHRGGDFTLRQEILSDRQRPVLLWLLELEGQRELEVELACHCELRPMWPAGLGGQLGMRDPSTGALALTEETGRFAALLGAAGGRVREAPDGRGLPRRPVRMVARLRPGEPTPIVFAAAQRPERPPSHASRVGRGQAAAGTWAARGVVDDARQLWCEASEDWRGLVDRTRRAWERVDRDIVRLHCGDHDAERAFAWSQVVAERSWVRVPGLGRTQVAGLAPSRDGDRPGFGWTFEGDALLAARVLGGMGAFTPAARSLWNAAGHQRADGKLAHEVVLSADLCQWFERYPYAYYRGLTGAQFAVALSRCVLASGDAALGRALLPTLDAALEWFIATRDERGLATTTRAGLGAIQSGPLSEAIEVDAYLHGGLYGALQAGAQLARWLGEDDRAEAWEATAAEVAEAFETLWDEETGRYAYAITREGRALTDRAGLAALPLSAGLGRDDRALSAAAQLTHPHLSTDWGLRQLDAEASHYHPDNYNGGSVFPLHTAQAALACYRVGRTETGHLYLTTLLRLEGLGGRGLVEEHLPGDRARLSTRRVPRHLVGSMAALAALVDGALGYRAHAGRGDAPDRVRLRIQHPLPWAELTLSGLRVGARTFDLHIARRKVRGEGAAHTELAVELVGAPGTELDLGVVLPAHSEVLRVDSDGDTDFHVRELEAGAEELQVPKATSGRATVALRQGPTLSIPAPPVERDATSAGVRPVSVTSDEAGTTFVFTGPPGTAFEAAFSTDREVTVVGADRALRADGSECLQVTIPADDAESTVSVALRVER